MRSEIDEEKKEVVGVAMHPPWHDLSRLLLSR